MPTLKEIQKKLERIKELAKIFQPEKTTTALSAPAFLGDFSTTPISTIPTASTLTQKEPKTEKPKKTWTYYYPDLKTGKPVGIEAVSQTEARKQAAALGLPTTEVLPTWKIEPKTRVEEIRKGLEEIETKIPTLQTEFEKIKAAKEANVEKEITPKTEKIIPKTEEIAPSKLYDISKIQSDLTAASTEKKNAYDELIGLQAKTYETEYNKAGLGDLRKRINDIDAQIRSRKNDLIRVEDEINENPWLSETGRIGRVRRLYDMAQKEINNLIDERNSLTKEYNATIDEITRKVGYATSDAQTKYSYWEKEERRLSDLAKTYQTELFKMLEKGVEPPKIFGSAEVGYYQLVRDPKTGKWSEQMIIPPAPKEKKAEAEITPEIIETYARDVLAGRIKLSSVPNKIQAQVSRRVEELRKTERTRSDEEIRSWIRAKLKQTEIRILPTNEEKKAVIRDEILLDKELTEADKTRVYLILDELLPEEKPATVKEWWQFWK